MRLLVSLLLVFVGLTTSANVAQPGLFNAGGANPFTLLFQQDTIFYKQIQMQRERVSIDLYRGYAVVKGQYWMHNPLDTAVTFTTGYPINSYQAFNSTGSNGLSFDFDSLYQMRVIVNGQTIERGSRDMGYDGNWYTWETTFAADTTTLIEVYFLMRTDNSYIREGYSKERFDGFIYILETGSIWKQPILKGEVLVQLRGGLTSADIVGAWPQDIFHRNSDGDFYYYNFEELTPTHDDNIAIITKSEGEPKAFDEIMKHADLYFRDVDKTSALEVDTATLGGYVFDDPFSLDGSGLGIDKDSLKWVLWIAGPFLLLMTILLIKVLLNGRNRKS